MSDHLTEQTGIATWKALPDDFVLQVHVDDKRHAITERVSLTVEAQRHMPSGRVLAWAEKCAQELRQIFLRTYKVKGGKVFVCSSVEPDGTLQVYLQADLEHELLGGESKKQLYGTMLGELKRDRSKNDVIDI